MATRTEAFSMALSWSLLAAPKHTTPYFLTYYRVTNPTPISTGRHVPGRPPKLVGLLLYLRGQLPGGGQHQHADLPIRSSKQGVHLLVSRQQERQSFARPSFSDGDDISLRHRYGPALRLDGGGGAEPGIVERPQLLLRQPGEIFELFVRVWYVSYAVWSFRVKHRQVVFFSVLIIIVWSWRKISGTFTILRAALSHTLVFGDVGRVVLDSGAHVSERSQIRSRWRRGWV